MKNILPATSLNRIFYILLAFSCLLSFVKPPVALFAGLLFALVFESPYPSFNKKMSKYLLQASVVGLGFGMNLSQILAGGKQSLPIIISTITTSLIIAFILYKALKLKTNNAILVGVGSSICGGSAIAATAPVIDATDEEVAQSISVIFLFNVLAALIFPTLGAVLGLSNEGFGLFAGTAINDTSSVTAAASTWDSMWNLGSETLNTAVTVKLTRTLAIIPITLVLSLIRARSASKAGTADSSANKFSLKRAFPMFILYFIIAAIITTVCMSMGVSADVFAPLKELSKFFIIMAMAAIGLNSNVVKLIKSGGKPLLLGACCWVGITIVSLGMQHVMHIW